MSSNSNDTNCTFVGKPASSPIPMAIRIGKTPTSKPSPLLLSTFPDSPGRAPAKPALCPQECLLNSQLSCDLRFEDVFQHAPSRQDSLAVEEPADEEEDANSDEDTLEHQASMVEQAQAELESDGPVQSSAVTDKPNSKVDPSDFEILRVVGQGAFGKVFQVRYKRTGAIFAMKVMRKERILEKDHSEYVRAERDVLTAIFHPYIVTLRFSFQTPSKLYLVLDFINGGHLFFQLYRQGMFSEAAARLYTAEIVSAISYLHSRGIVHRDLKPENVLMDSDGHIRITDFGLAKPNMQAHTSRTNSFIGTMEYMAPEIIEGKGHGKEVDWWSTGVLLYEMLVGVPPFRSKSRVALQKEITIAKPKYPKFLSSEALSLLKGLLARDPAKRLGVDGSDAIKKHAFFKGMNWTKLEARQVPASFKPTVPNSLSVENFDKIWTDQAAVDSPCGTPTDPKSMTAFEGFSYVAPCVLEELMAIAQLNGLELMARGA